MLQKKVAVCNQEFENSIRRGGLYFDGDILEIDNHCFYFEHYLYEMEKTTEQYFHDFMVNKKEFVEKIKGEFCLVDYDILENTLFVATDRLGKEAPWIYQKGETLILVNDFWRGIELIKPQESDIDWQTVKEIIIHGTAIGNSTVVKNYEFVPAASMGEVKLNESLEMNYKRYWKFKFQPDPSIQLEDAADQIHKLFNETFALMEKKFPKGTKFGVGLSGGWDSRLVVAYAKKHHLNIVPYCIGEKYSIFPLPTNGYYVVKKLAKYFRLNNFTFIPYNGESYIQKMADDVLLAPLKGAETSIGCRSCVPDFDIMLNGEMGGEFFGEFTSRFSELLNYNKENIGEYLLKYLSFTQLEEMIFTPQEKEYVKKKIKNYVGQMDTDDRFDIVYRFWLEIYAARSKCGFFETVYGTKERYSPYLNPDFLDYFCTWDSKFLCDRVLQRKFFMKYFPKLSRIPDESAYAPLYWREMNVKNVPYQFLYGLRQFVFKSSLRRGVWLKRDREFYELLKTVVKKNHKILKKHFPGLDVKKFLKENSRATEKLVKMLIEVDTILNYHVTDRRAFINNKYGNEKE